MMSYTVRGKQMQGLCGLCFQVPPSPETSLGGWEPRAWAANPARMCRLPCSARASPRPREKRLLSSSRARSHPRPGTLRGRSSDPTYHAGRGRRDGSGELALGLPTRPARTGQVMVPAGSGSPPPKHKEPLPHPGPTGTL